MRESGWLESEGLSHINAQLVLSDLNETKMPKAMNLRLGKSKPPVG